ncbi:uncharacterized protein LOC126426733 isoform X6 [Schistocerca serialis cubense]|uniref:uncharacterized protein LOC126426733 isoform X6 n=1 Tax=Schistocerca serialis cubense TaxID=2023355 RepID=UPI00214E4E12|nr:uncharacterized protein LOC126426733 isoform X6 [Schistocerca serialis cubense]
MDDMNTNWIKQEITDEVPSEPDPMVLEDPEGNSCPMDFIKEDPELHVDETENTVLEDPEGNSCPTDFIKEDPELHVDETENTVLASMRCASDSVSHYPRDWSHTRWSIKMLQLALVFDLHEIK